MPTSWLARVASTGRTFGRGLLHLLLPGCCQLCGRSLPDRLESFCDPCRDKLLHDPDEICPRCAGRVGPFTVHDGRCHHCRDEAFAFERVMRLGPYDDLVREVVLKLKHGHNEALAELIGARWALYASPAFQALNVNSIVPVPLHWRRRWQRGYNQSAAIAWGLGSVLQLPVERRGLRRVRNTPKQTEQTPSSRRDNVRGAFQPGWAAPRLIGKNILLVDDVMTTGATAHEAARALRQLGAKRVIVGVLARAT